MQTARLFICARAASLGHPQPRLTDRMNVFLSVVAIVLYGLAGSLQIRRIKSNNGGLVTALLAFGALGAHAVAAITAIYTDQGMDLGLPQTLSLISWMICLITLIASFRRPVQSLLVILYPLAALALVAELTLPPYHDVVSHVGTGVFVHILSSILAYSVLSVAAALAIVLAIQDKRLKQHKLLGLSNLLPPLQTIEEMLFEFIWAGFALLTLAIASGTLYVEDLLAQHLVHKTVFSVVAWLLFAILLWGRLTLGWRGRTAIRWTLWAFAFLMLAYIGTQVVLQWILN